MSRSLRGKVVVITGGARGIGAATAQALVREGARVVIGDLDAAAARACAERLGSDVLALPLDVTDLVGFTKFLDEVEGRVGPLDVLINNAGIMPVAALDEESDASVVRQLEINLHAVIHGTREAVRRMRPRRSGHIVNVASFAGKAGFPGVATYCATKHGVVGYSEAARLELRGSGIEVSCVMPGIVRTELAAGLRDVALLKSVTAEDVANAIVKALRRPHFDVYVPRSAGALGRIGRLLPRAGGEWLMRTLGGDTLMLDAVHSGQRKEYEARAAASAPATKE